MGQGRGVDHRAAAVRRLPDRDGVEQVVAVGAVEAGYLVAEAGQVIRDRGPDVAAVARHQDAHALMIGREPAIGPVNFGDDGRPAPLARRRQVTMGRPSGSGFPPVAEFIKASSMTAKSTVKASGSRTEDTVSKPSRGRWRS
jgi:hypothetical protein